MGRGGREEKNRYDATSTAVIRALRRRLEWREAELADWWMWYGQQQQHQQRERKRYGHQQEPIGSERVQLSELQQQQQQQRQIQVRENISNNGFNDSRWDHLDELS